jgi:hypothetical protein
MRQYFVILLLMGALSVPSVYAEETAPADDGTSTTKPADPSPKPEGEEEEEEEEPDCE